MKNQITKLFLLSILLLPSISYAELINCGQHGIDTLYVQGDRDDNGAYANTAVVVLTGDLCNGKSTIYIENDNPNYDAFLSILLTAKATNEMVGVKVNSSKTIAGATQMAIIYLK